MLYTLYLLSYSCVFKAKVHISQQISECNMHMHTDLLYGYVSAFKQNNQFYIVVKA